jgi:site-specific DNA-methyltransferase (adenine-specific)
MLTIDTLIESAKSVAFNEDCMIGMASFPDKYFDLAVVDPPYGISVGINGTVGINKAAPCKQYKPVEWDFESPKEDYFSELVRVSKNQIIWGANHFISRMPIDSSCWLVWDKDNTGNFADCELAWASFKTAVRKFEFRWNGMLQGDMKNKESRIHPTQKPVALYDWIYKNYLPQGGKVIDTHLGSGSNRIAAHKAGNIEFTAYEIDKDYFDAQEKRFRNHISQLKLF